MAHPSLDMPPGDGKGRVLPNNIKLNLAYHIYRGNTIGKSLELARANDQVAQHIVGILAPMADLDVDRQESRISVSQHVLTRPPSAAK